MKSPPSVIAIVCETDGWLLPSPACALIFEVMPSYCAVVSPGRSMMTATFGCVPEPSSMLWTGKIRGSNGGMPAACILSMLDSMKLVKASADSQTSMIIIPSSVSRPRWWITPAGGLSGVMPMSSFTVSYISCIPPGSSAIARIAIYSPFLSVPGPVARAAFSLLFGMTRCTVLCNPLIDALQFRPRRGVEQSGSSPGS